MFERVAQGLHVYRGAAIGYYQVRERKMTSALSMIMRTHYRYIYIYIYVCVCVCVRVFVCVCVS